MFLTVSDAALNEIRAIVAKQKINIEEVYIVLGLKLTKNAFSYNLHVVDSILENSIIQTVDEIKFVLNEKFVPVYTGLKLDYILEATKTGFIFDNPNIETFA